MEIELKDYEDLMLLQDKARARAAELLEISEDEVADYIENNYQWHRNDMEYQYMGYDCEDCYMGGDIKMAITCGDYFVMHAICPNYKRLSVWKRKGKL